MAPEYIGVRAKGVYKISERSIPVMNNISPAENQRPEIRHDLVQMLYGMGGTSIVGHLVFSALSVLVLWGKVAPHILLPWVASMYVLLLVRVLMIRQYLRSPVETRRLKSNRRAWRFAIFAGLTGCLWGILGLFFLGSGDRASLPFITGAIVSGVLCAALTALSPFRPAYYFFALPTVVPYIAACFFQQETAIVIFGVMALLLLAVNINYSRIIHAALFESVKLRFENIALLRQTEIEREAALAATVAKSKFLAAVSHDLRQPIHAMGLFAFSLEKLSARGTLNHEQLRTTSGRLRDAIGWLGKMLSTLLHISKLDVGAVAANQQPINLQALLQAVRDQMQDEAKNRGVELRIRKTSLFGLSDQIILQQQIISNLVANAIRYSRSRAPDQPHHAARIVLGCRRRGGRSDGHSGGHIEIQVWDNGIGIAEREFALIFDEFYQVSNEARNPEMGQGLGLAIVRRYAGLLGHQISVRSKLGQGTLFSVLIPRAEKLPAPPDNATPPVTQARRAHRNDRTDRAPILVIDDNVQVLAAMELLLQTWGYAMVGATSLDESNAKVAAAQGNVSMIIADFRLGNQATGVDAIRHVTALVGRAVPALIITADTSDEGIRQAAAGGYTVLHKPLDEAELEREIEKSLT
jgi:signal transduction histidine kinase/CheY-like chemotaxis protein